MKIEGDLSSEQVAVVTIGACGGKVSGEMEGVTGVVDSGDVTTGFAAAGPCCVGLVCGDVGVGVA